jgi:AcrR family transcriptional regulator
MTEFPFQDSGRINQKRRTRRALVEAAAHLVRAGRQPTVAEAAAAALISKATAYRYFPTQQSLLIEAALEGTRPDAAAILQDVPAEDAAARFDAACRALHALVVGDEVLFRTMVRATQEQWLAQAGRGTDQRLPVREGRRLHLIDAALTPLAPRLSASAYRQLRMGLSLALGIEGLIVLEDVCGASPDEALAVLRWVGASLIGSAEREAGAAD